MLSMKRVTRLKSPECWPVVVDDPREVFVTRAIRSMKSSSEVCRFFPNALNVGPYLNEQRLAVRQGLKASRCLDP